MKQKNRDEMTETETAEHARPGTPDKDLQMGLGAFKGAQQDGC
jgi:hypothetical protein